MEFKPGWSKEVSFNYVIILLLDGVDTNTLHNIARYNLPVDNTKRTQSEEQRVRESELDQFNITAQHNATRHYTHLASSLEGMIFHFADPPFSGVVVSSDLINDACRELLPALETPAPIA